MGGNRDLVGGIRDLAFALALTVPVTLVGCAAPEPAPSGFLLDVEQLEPAPSGALVYRRSGFSLADYDSILLEPVQIFCGSSSNFDRVDPLELKRLARSFEDAIQRELESTYSFVGTIGPRVMRLRLAITNVEVRRRPIRDALDTLSKDVGFHLSDVSMEGEILDSRSGERLAAFVDRQRSRQSEGASAFEFWAARLRERMDEEHSAP